MADLTTDLGKLTLKNPVMTASGTFGYGYEYHRYYDIAQLGAVVVKGIRMTPSHGNPTPRVAEVTGGSLNAIGLQGPGVENFLHGEHYLPFLRNTGATVIVNIWGTTIAEYGEVAAGWRLRSRESRRWRSTSPVRMSRPAASLSAPTADWRRRWSTRCGAPPGCRSSPNSVRTSPTSGSLPRAVEGAGSDMVSLINTLTAMAIDIETRRPKIANRTGGFSGPALKPIAVRMVYEAAKAVRIPVIGMGGIMNGADAVEFLLAGARAVAVGTANFVDPFAPLKVIDGINEYLDRHGCRSVSEIVGALEA